MRSNVSTFSTQCSAMQWIAFRSLSSARRRLQARLEIALQFECISKQVQGGTRVKIPLPLINRFQLNSLRNRTTTGRLPANDVPGTYRRIDVNNPKSFSAVSPLKLLGKSALQGSTPVH